MSALNAPTGLQLGSDDLPFSHLSIVSHMQAVMTGTTGTLERKGNAAEVNHIVSASTTDMACLTGHVMTHNGGFEREVTL